MAVRAKRLFMAVIVYRALDDIRLVGAKLHGLGADGGQMLSG
jgi:hypothetical protein